MMSSATAVATKTTTTKSLTIVITGASKGLGLGMAKSYLKMGHKLGLCARSTSPPEELVRAASDAAAVASGSNNEDRHFYYESVDVSNELSVQKFLHNVVQKFGGNPIDVWINNAGILGPIEPIRNLSSTDFEQTIQINLMSVFYATKAYINHIRHCAATTTTTRSSSSNTNINNDDDDDAKFQRRDYTLINISSGASIKGYASWGAYCASKASVDRLTECAFLEEKEGQEQTSNEQQQQHILRAYSIAPGIIDTDMQATIRDTPKTQFPMVDKFLDIKANNAFNTPTYVANQLMNEYIIPEGPQTSPVVQRLPSEKQVK